MVTSPAAPHRKPEFDRAAREALQGLKRALGEVVDSLPGARITRASQLASVLELDTRLAWKIAKIVEAKDPLMAARYLPGESGERIFLRAAKRHNAAVASVRQATEAFRQLREVIRLHAGDRQTFDSMIAGHMAGVARQSDLEHRKGSFRHARYIWGVQARVHLQTYILRASEAPGYYDAATVRGFVDLRWIRPNVPWRIWRMYSVDDAGDAQTRFVREPLSRHRSQSPDETDIPLFHEFCSQPAPEYRRLEGPAGDTTFHLVEAPVGNLGATTCILGEVVRRAEPRYRDQRHRELVVASRARTPSELLLMDLIVQRDLLGPISPKLAVYSDLFVDSSTRKPVECDRLPVAESVELVAGGVDGIRVPEIPRYSEMIRCAFERLGWNAGEFDVYRVRMPYPPIPTEVRISQTLPEPPRGSA